MQRIGHVLHVSTSRNLILKTKKVPRMGDRVVDENFHSVGTVFEVFGPTSSPYVAVRPSRKDPERLVDQVLYVVSSRRRKKKREN